jgi:hypothetical protein
MESGIMTGLQWFITIVTALLAAPPFLAGLHASFDCRRLPTFSDEWKEQLAFGLGLLSFTALLGTAGALLIGFAT